MKEVVMSIWVILLYVIRRAGTLSVDEKVYILELAGYITRRAEQVDGSTLLREVTQYLSSPNDHLLAPSQASRNSLRTLHP